MADAKLAGRSVLVVEDEYYLADDLVRTLKGAGATIIGPVPTVTAALDLLRRDQVPNVAVLDINLGGEMVYPVADMLAARGIPYLFATGYDKSAIPAPYGSALRLQKPAEPHQVIDALAEIAGAAP